MFRFSFLHLYHASHALCFPLVCICLHLVLFSSCLDAPCSSMFIHACMFRSSFLHLYHVSHALFNPFSMCLFCSLCCLSCLLYTIMYGFHVIGCILCIHIFLPCSCMCLYLFVLVFKHCYTYSLCLHACSHVYLPLHMLSLPACLLACLLSFAWVLVCLLFVSFLCSFACLLVSILVCCMYGQNTCATSKMQAKGYRLVD